MEHDRPRTTEEIIAEALKEGVAASDADRVIQDILSRTMERIRELDERYRRDRGEIWSDALRSIRAAKRGRE